VGMVSGRQILFEMEEPPSAPPAPADYRTEVIPGERFIETLCASGSNPVATPTVMTRTSVQHAVGGDHQALPHTADMERWLRFAARGAIGFVDADLALKRYHGRNMQVDYAAVRDFAQRKAAFDIFFESHGRELARRDRLRAMAYGSLGTEAFWGASRAFENG